MYFLTLDLIGSGSGAENSMANKNKHNCNNFSRTLCSCRMEYFCIYVCFTEDILSEKENHTV